MHMQAQERSSIASSCQRCGADRSLSPHSNPARSPFCRPCGLKAYFEGKPKRSPEDKRAYQREHYQRTRKERDEYTNRWRQAQRLRAIEALGGKCVNCGIDDEVVLNIDHVNNDGARHRNLSSATFHKLVIDSAASGEFQLLCCNCNWRKEHERRRGNAVS